MSIKVSELAYCRLQVSDPDRAEQFLTDFGLIAAGRENARRYFRATDAGPYCYILEEGPTRFLGFAFHAKTRADLDSLAAEREAAVEAIDAPGGGWRVRLREPNGYDVDVVFGIAPSAAIDVRRQLLNIGSQRLQRAGELFRVKRGEATPVKRLAHVVLATPLVAETVRWFHETLGMISSDDVVGGPTGTLIGSFIRLDEGDEYVDHHTVFIINGPRAGLHHISFESQDLDAVLADHHHLKAMGRYQHAWGIGRHTLGAQIFDYWASPDGYLHEHWADTDRLNASAPTNTWDVHEGMITQWGDETPAAVREAARP